MSCPLIRLMELAAHFSETDRRPKNMMLRLPYTEQNYHIQQYDADFDKQKLYTVKDDTIILISYFIKNKLNSLDEQEWIGTFEKIGEKFLSSTVIEDEIISKDKEPVQ